MTGTVSIEINGETQEVAAGSLLVDLLAARGVDPRRVVVERNRHPVPRAEQASIVVSDGDAYEVVHLVGGG